MFNTKHRDIDESVLLSGAIDSDIRKINTVRIMGADDISSIILTRICNMWQIGIAINRIVTKVNPFLIEGNKLIAADIYGIVYGKINDGTLKQRKSPANEIPVDKFKEMIKLWQAGVPATLLIKQFGVFGTETFVRSVMLAISRRTKEDRAKQKKKILEVDVQMIRTRLFGCAKFKCIEGREAIVMFLDEMTDDMRRKSLQSLPKLKPWDITQARIEGITVERLKEILLLQKERGQSSIDDIEEAPEIERALNDSEEELDQALAEVEKEVVEDGVNVTKSVKTPSDIEELLREISEESAETSLPADPLKWGRQLLENQNKSSAEGVT